jgi:UDP-N-acetylmuramoyl-tripeptide--D-alanyl-D-alanine ligase
MNEARIAGRALVKELGIDELARAMGAVVRWPHGLKPILHACGHAQGNRSCRVGTAHQGRGGGQCPPYEGIVCTGVSTDSRTVGVGDCFFALPGQNFDGHDHVAQAFAKGAVCAVVSRDVSGLVTSDKPLLFVRDTVEALGDLARWYRRAYPFKVVAITGSVGKTTTRQIVHHVLASRFATHQAQKSFNNAIGLPLTILGAQPSDEIIVAELGANHPGEISHLTDIALPDVAVVTNVYPAHLEGFGDLAGIVREKISIAQGLSSDGVLIVNGDIEPLVNACRDTGKAFRTFGRAASADYRAEQIAHEALTSTFTIRGRRIVLPLPGPGNVDNALAAWAICERLGLTIDEFAEAVASLPQVAMRAEPLQIGEMTVLNDCYNANPASMNNALAILANLRRAAPNGDKRRLVFICGWMAELGASSEQLHAELGKAAAQAHVDILLTVGEPTRATAQAAKEAAGAGLQAHHFDDVGALCNNLQQWVRPDDIILVKGSRAARLETVIEKLTKDDR